MKSGCLFVLTVSFFSLAGETVAGRPPHMPLGVNLDSLNDCSPQQMFVDLMKTGASLLEPHKTPSMIKVSHWATTAGRWEISALFCQPIASTQAKRTVSVLRALQLRFLPMACQSFAT